MHRTEDKIVLSAENIKKSFVKDSTRLDVLQGVNLEAKRGEICCITGRSGVGKSTLLHILGALDTPYEGRVMLNGIDIFSLRQSEIAKLRNQKIGFVFQFHHLLPEFSALENVMMPAVIYGSNYSLAEERAKELLVQMGLSERLLHRPSELSGGEQQRVALARALIMNPDVVLADEPTGNLDPATASQIHELIWKLNKETGQTFVIVTHNEELAGKTGSIYRIHDGVATRVMGQNL